MKEDFSIRELTSADEPFLWEMLYQAIHIPEGQLPPPRSIIEEPKLAHYVRQWGQKPSDMGLVAVVNNIGRPVGAAWLRVFSRLDPGYGFVDEHTPELSIAMLPDYRGQGLGSRLLNALLQAARQKFEAVSLSVSLDNPARKLYERFGFAEVSADGASFTMLKRLQ